jgi:hypothetical protein
MSLPDIIGGYQYWIKDNSETGKEIYLVTFQFNHISANPKTALDIMRKEIERFYVVLLLDVVRRPRRAAHLDNLPQLIAIPDRPTSKRASTHRLSDIRPNDGVHFHIFLAIPQVSRLKEDLATHIQQNEMRYRGNQGKIMKIDVRPVANLDGRLVDYTFKHIKRRSFSLDDILILPRSQSELKPRSSRVVKK